MSTTHVVELLQPRMRKLAENFSCCFRMLRRTAHSFRFFDYLGFPEGLTTNGGMGIMDPGQRKIRVLS